MERITKIYFFNKNTHKINSQGDTVERTFVPFLNVVVREEATIRYDGRKTMNSKTAWVDLTPEKALDSINNAIFESQTRNSGVLVKYYYKPTSLKSHRVSPRKTTVRKSATCKTATRRTRRA